MGEGAKKRVDTEHNVSGLVSNSEICVLKRTEVNWALSQLGEWGAGEAALLRAPFELRQDNFLHVCMTLTILLT